MKHKKIVIAAANGYLGKILAKYFTNKGFEVIGLCRKQTILENAECVLWDGKSLGNWAKELEGATALINLAGKSVDCRYTDENKQLILSSRVESTKVLGEAVSNCINPPKVWLNSSSATIYRHAEDRNMDEDTGEIGGGFSVDVCKTWEHTFFGCNTPQIRKVAMRISFVLGNDGGAYPTLKKLVKLGLGGKMGQGTQYISWIHEKDFCKAVEFLIGNKVEGAVNLSSPNPVQNRTFMGAMRKRYNIPFGMPQPKWLLEFGAKIIKTETELTLKSRRVVSKRLADRGFEFKHEKLDDALKNL
ncbi:MAG: TIGR01777 family oxidoreductase [bacterium]